MLPSRYRGKDSARAIPKTGYENRFSLPSVKQRGAPVTDGGATRKERRGGGGVVWELSESQARR